MPRNTRISKIIGVNKAANIKRKDDWLDHEIFANILETRPLPSIGYPPFYKIELMVPSTNYYDFITKNYAYDVLILAKTDPLIVQAGNLNLHKLLKFLTNTVKMLIKNKHIPDIRYKITVLEEVAQVLGCITLGNE